MTRRLSDAQKQLTGTLRKLRAKARGTPAPRAELSAPPVAPGGLTAVELAHFHELTRMLATLGVLTLVDGTALGACAQCIADREELRSLIKTEGCFYLTTSARGPSMKKPHPALAALATKERELRQWLDALALTPAARLKFAATDLRAPSGGMLLTPNDLGLVPEGPKRNAKGWRTEPLTGTAADYFD